jgi:Flp pilus assembly protein TadG
MRNGKTTLQKIIRALGIREEGGAIAETALTAPFLALLIFGSVEFARVAYAAIEVTNAARAGVSYGAQSGLTASDTAGIKWAATHDGVNIPGMTVSNPVLGYTCSDNSATSGNPPTCTNNGAHLVETVTVQTQVTMDPLIHVAGLPTTYTLYGTAVQTCYQ